MEFEDHSIKVTNNIVEYKALLLGLLKMKSLGKQFHCKSGFKDSKETSSKKKAKLESRI